MESAAVCGYCFSLLESIFLVQDIPSCAALGNDKFPLFITWKMQSNGVYILRGCIGTFTPIPLSHGIHEFTLKSAFQDSRFNPISHDELKHLQVTISLLVDFEETELYAWEIGKHGITIHDSKNSATFLPEVALEQGWTHEQTIDALMRKGGITTISRIVRYSSIKYSMNYSQFLEKNS